MDVNTVMLGIGLVIIFGFVAEFIFKKTGVPDLLLLVILGFIIGPNVYDLVDISLLTPLVPVFTTFALVFLLFEGGLSIDLDSFAKGLLSGTSIAIFNFVVTSVALTLLLALVFNMGLALSLLMAFTLSGVSSSFVVPLLKELNVKGPANAILLLESAITDVFTIVLALTTIQLIEINTFSVQAVLSQIINLFAVAGLIGVIGAMLWIFIDKHLVKEQKSYMSTIAYLLVLYFITEYMGGNGAIAALFFGLVLRNSKQIDTIISDITKAGQPPAQGVLSETEYFFHSQISFFLKTFFFVYIGLLLNLRDPMAVFIGVVASFAMLIARKLNLVMTYKMEKRDQSLINAMFAAGIAAAAVMQMAYEAGVVISPLYLDITYIVIVVTTFLSSITVFIHRMRFPS